MKCNKCGEELVPEPGKSLNFCPNCGETINRTVSTTSPDDVIKSLVSQYGEDILVDSKLLSLVADTLKNETPNILRRIRLAINEGIPKSIYEMRNYTEQERTFKITAIVKTLVDGYGMEQDVAYKVISCFTDALEFGVGSVQTNLFQQSTYTHTSNANSSRQSLPTLSDVPKVGETLHFGSYEWQVLDVQDSKALLLSKHILELRAYNSASGDTSWAECDLRSYLNTSFYESLGQDAELVVETENANNDNLWFDISGCNATKDKVFLLSVDEMLQYFGDSGIYKKLIGAYESFIDDQYNSSRIAKDKSGTEIEWWLRSPGCWTDKAATINTLGYIFLGGCVTDYAEDIYGGVRPALWVRLPTSNLKSINLCDNQIIINNIKINPDDTVEDIVELTSDGLKVGDRVKVVLGSHGENIDYGHIVEVPRNYRLSSYYTVRFDNGELYQVTTSSMFPCSDI